VVHTRDSFLGWLVMYFTNSVWSHSAISIGNGAVVEVTLGGTIAHPFADLLNNADYLLIGGPDLSAEEEVAVTKSALSRVGVTKFSYLTALIIGCRTFIGRDPAYRFRLSADPLTVLLISCWIGRRHRMIYASCTAGALLLVGSVLINARKRELEGDAQRRFFQEARDQTLTWIA
jgi:hypothetical protein